MSARGPCGVKKSEKIAKNRSRRSPGARPHPWRPALSGRPDWEVTLDMVRLVNRFRGKRVYTTIEAAEICRLPHQTIIRCIDNGKLRGFRQELTGLRCVSRRELRRFIKICGTR